MNIFYSTLHDHATPGAPEWIEQSLPVTNGSPEMMARWDGGTEMTDLPTRLTEALADRYRIERRLGEGGMATVYLAHDIRHNRPVAVKVLRPELAAAGPARRVTGSAAPERRTRTGSRHDRCR